MTDADRKDMARFVNRLRILRSLPPTALPSEWSYHECLIFKSNPVSYMTNRPGATQESIYRILRDLEANPIVEGDS